MSHQARSCGTLYPFICEYGAYLVMRRRKAELSLCLRRDSYSNVCDNVQGYDCAILVEGQQVLRERD